jgi:hypothetical protein
MDPGTTAETVDDEALNAALKTGVFVYSRRQNIDF